MCSFASSWTKRKLKVQYCSSQIACCACAVLCPTRTVTFLTTPNMVCSSWRTREKELSLTACHLVRQRPAEFCNCIINFANVLHEMPPKCFTRASNCKCTWRRLDLAMFLSLVDVFRQSGMGVIAIISLILSLFGTEVYVGCSGRVSSGWPSFLRF